MDETTESVDEFLAACNGMNNRSYSILDEKSSPNLSNVINENFSLQKQYLETRSGEVKFEDSKKAGAPPIQLDSKIRKSEIWVCLRSFKL